MTLLDKVKGVSLKALQKLPEPVKKLATLKSDEERKEYLKTLPNETITSMLKFTTYVLLTTDVLSKAEKLGIAVPSEVKSFLDKVDSEAKKAGKLTKEAVSTAVDVVISTLAVGVAIAVILFGAFLILNPQIALALLLSSLIFEAALFFFPPPTPEDKKK